MWSYITNKTTILIVVVCILTVFIIIQWYETKKLRHKISKIDKQIHSLGKNQIQLENIINSRFISAVPTPSPPPSKPQRVYSKKPVQLQPTTQPVKQNVSMKPQPLPQTIIETIEMSLPTKQIFVVEPTIQPLPQENKIEEIDDESSSSSEDDNSGDEENFNDKTLDMELQNELNELK